MKPVGRNPKGYGTEVDGSWISYHSEEVESLDSNKFLMSMYSGSIFSCKFNQIREKWSRGATNLEKLSSQFPSIGTITWRNCLIFWCWLRLLFVRVWSPTFYFHREERISRSFPSESSIHGEVDTMMRMNLLGGWLHFLFFLRHRLSRICWNIGIWTQPADKRWICYKEKLRVLTIYVTVKI